MDALYTFLVGLVETALSEQCIRENQSAPRPTLPYTTVHLTTIAREGHEFSSKEDIDPVDITETVEGQRTVSASFNFYGNDAGDRASNFILYLKSESIKYTWQVSDFGMGEITGPRDLTYLVDGRFEDRQQIDMLISTVQTFETTIRSIETIEVNDIEVWPNE